MKNPQTVLTVLWSLCVVGAVCFGLYGLGCFGSDHDNRPASALLVLASGYVFCEACSRLARLLSPGPPRD